MSRVYLRSVPFEKEAATLALEAGVDGLIVPRENVDLVRQLSRCDVLAAEDIELLSLDFKADEETALQKMKSGSPVVIVEGWEVIPIENLLAQSDRVMVEAKNLERARLAAGILEKGVAAVVVDGVGEIRETVRQCKAPGGRQNLVGAKITRIAPVGLGHRVCADTISLLRRGQGMLVGNSNSFSFLVHAETEHNEYVASRPFRVNAGAVHAYVHLPGDKTEYLGEMRQGQEVLIVDADGACETTTLGRVKIEVRPMLLIEAEVENPEKGGEPLRGSVFLQNAETIRLVGADGAPISVVALSEGDMVLCKVEDMASGRHFGMRISEEIREV